ncbi:hypothetical protein SRHO_G00291990 [Serrasalmus rhombeus]
MGPASRKHMAVKVAKAGIQVRTGKKWRAEEAVQEAEPKLRHRSLVGVLTRGQAGLGSFLTAQRNTRGKERQHLVQEERLAAVDLEQQLKFPRHIAVTITRPDIVPVSESTKQAVLLELTVPREDHLEEAFERKLSKYAGQVSDCQQAGWRARCLPVEVRCRGFVAHSLARALSSLGIVGEQKRRAILNTTEAAERASRWLWLKRGEPWSRGS